MAYETVDICCFYIKNEQLRIIQTNTCKQKKMVLIQVRTNHILGQKAWSYRKEQKRKISKNVELSKRPLKHVYPLLVLRVAANTQVMTSDRMKASLTSYLPLYRLLVLGQSLGWGAQGPSPRPVVEMACALLPSRGGYTVYILLGTA